MIEFIFRHSRKYMVCKNAFSGVLLIIETEDASETQFPTPKLEPTNTPIYPIGYRLSTCIRMPHRKCNSMVKLD